jgi:hypothetical protein
VSEIERDVSFCLGGNSEPFLGSGWSEPEAGLTWSDGPESTLIIRPSFQNGDYLIIIQGRPYLRRPDVRVQRVEISAAGNSLIDFAADDETQFVSWFKIRALPVQDAPIHLTIHLPDHASPSSFGLQDTRRLGIALMRLRVIRLSYSSKSLAPYSLKQKLCTYCFNSEKASELSRVVSDLIKRREFSKARGLLVNQVSAALEGAYPHSDHVCTLLLQCLALQDQSSLSRMLKSLFQWPGLDADFYDCPTNDPAVARVEFLGSGALRILFSRSISRLNPITSWGAIWTIASYALNLFPLLIRYATSQHIAGTVNVTLADEAHVRGLAFSGCTPDTTLIPDPMFLSTDGYSEFREYVLANSLDWKQRRSVVFWRGSTTGTRRGHSARGLDRVRLCIIAQQLSNRPFFDVGLTALSQVEEEEEQQELHSAGLMKEFVAPERLNEWKLTVDIDGNSNSWAGTFQKLLSGCLLLKVESREGWRQWYYDLLQPFQNFVPVHYELNDLVEKSKYLIYNTDYSEKIARAGQELAFSLSFESQCDAALRAIERGIIYDWVA